MESLIKDGVATPTPEQIWSHEAGSEAGSGAPDATTTTAAAAPDEEMYDCEEEETAEEDPGRRPVSVVPRDGSDLPAGTLQILDASYAIELLEEAIRGDEETFKMLTEDKKNAGELYWLLGVLAPEVTKRWVPLALTARERNYFWGVDVSDIVFVLLVLSFHKEKWTCPRAERAKARNKNRVSVTRNSESIRFYMKTMKRVSDILHEAADGKGRLSSWLCQEFGRRAESARGCKRARDKDSTEDKEDTEEDYAMYMNPGFNNIHLKGTVGAIVPV